MSADILAKLAALPPGTDIFPIVKSALNAEAGTVPPIGGWRIRLILKLMVQAFPTFPAAFWIGGYLFIGLCGLTTLFIASGLCIRYRKSTLKWWIVDGAVSRPDHRTFLPLLWILESVFLVVLFFWVTTENTNHVRSAALGHFWYLVHVPLLLSYSFLTLQTLSSAPPVRKLAGRLSQRARSSYWLYNLGFAIYASCHILALTPAIRFIGLAYLDMAKAYNQSIAVIDQAAADQDPRQLANLAVTLQALETGRNHLLRSIQIAGVTLLGLSALYLCTSIIPAFMLNAIIRRRVARLESTASYDSASLYSLSFGAPQELAPPEMPHADKRSSSTPSFKLTPRLDAPFSNVLPAQTTIVPQNFQAILNAQTDPAEKAKRLRAALQHENHMTLANVVLIVLFAAQSIFMASGSARKLNTLQLNMESFFWPAGNFQVIGLPYSIWFFYRSLRPGAAIAAPVELAEPTKGPPVTSIALHQEVQVEIAEGELKKYDISTHRLT